MRAFLADDHPSVRRGIASLLREEGWDIAGEAGSLAQIRADIRSAEPLDLVVLDVQLPDGDSLDLLKELRTEGFEVPVLVHSMLPDASVAAQALKAGANGYINKGCDPDELVRAARKVSEGGRYVSAEYTDILLSQLAGGRTTAAHESLSPKEFQVMCEYAQGKAPAEIAAAVGCQVSTLSAYRARILKKLDLKSTAEIMQYAVRHRLIRI